MIHVLFLFFVCLLFNQMFFFISFQILQFKKKILYSTQFCLAYFLLVFIYHFTMRADGLPQLSVDSRKTKSLFKQKTKQSIRRCKGCTCKQIISLTCTSVKTNCFSCELFQWPFWLQCLFFFSQETTLTNLVRLLSYSFGHIYTVINLEEPTLILK